MRIVHVKALFSVHYMLFSLQGEHLEDENNHNIIIARSQDILRSKQS